MLVSGIIPVLASGLIDQLDAVLTNYVWIFYAAFLTTFICTPIMSVVASRHDITDKPDKIRKKHGAPVAYLGGVALFVGWIAGMVACYFIPPHTVGVAVKIGIDLPVGILIGAAIISVLGLFDDIYHVTPRVKLLGQMLAAVALAGDGLGGNMIQGLMASVANTYGVSMAVMPSWLAQVVGIFVVIVFVIGCCNSLNLLDGLDGLASGITAIIVSAFTFIAVCLAVGLYQGSRYSLELNPVRIAMSLALLGAVLGFLPYNFRPAIIFMGDAGSMLLGYICAAIMLLLAEFGHPSLIFAVLMIFALPIMDSVLAIIRRKIRGVPIFRPDAHHLHHVMVRSGMSVRQSVMTLYAISLIFALLGSSLVFFRLRYVAAIFLFVFGFIAVMVYKLAHFQYLEEHAEAERARRNLFGVIGNPTVPPPPIMTDKTHIPMPPSVEQAARRDEEQMRQDLIV